MSKVKSLIPHLFTAGNLVGGVLAIIFALTGKLAWAPYCIFISAFLDFFDGFFARLLNVPSELGKQLDSLADMVTFGVAPGVIVYQLIQISLLNVEFGGMFDGFVFQNQIEVLDPRKFSETHYHLSPTAYFQSSPNISTTPMFIYLPLIALIIPVMSMFRLAKFNLDTRQTNSFIGVPTPANTLFFAAFPLIIASGITGTNSQLNQQILDTILLNPWFLVVATIIMSILLVVELPLFALKFKSFGFKGNEIRYIFLTLSTILLATLWWLAIPLIIILYILLSLIQNLRTR